MIFCGDTVFPNKYSKSILEETDIDFLRKQKIVNLESLIKIEEMKKTAKGIGLSSNKEIISFLKGLNVASCSQANNHITDFNTSINKQKEFLHLNGIGSFGAADTLEEASKPAFYSENDVKYGVLAFGWEVISCKGATESKKGVNPLRYDNVIKQVRSFLSEHSKVKLVCIFHWDYEFELYPQPAHRQLAFQLIDLGVSAIIGHHPHIVQGFEIYNNKPIFYSLGNFYFPDANYNGYEMKYSEEAKEGLCVELADNLSEITLYWTYLADNKRLLVTKQEKLLESEKLKELSTFSGMVHDEYIQWFSNNRKKSKGLPIYKTIDSKLETFFNNQLVKYRQSFIDLLVRAGVKK
ncbi:CapA family protein [Sulfurovum sp. AR]|uniref:CapA family protein n=1 Tax=Sulfurovum sp. AR TaxID=1165841 RepID=UPI00025C47BA|nr:CapA family protein [Sulfurovum sp. AR]EIF51218.1 putative poly-gamma-glutamate biosynthesis (capsule formation)-like protein [Sulfurovum sp. AR]